jgi:hypothetical protein
MDRVEQSKRRGVFVCDMERKDGTIGTTSEGATVVVVATEMRRECRGQGPRLVMKGCRGKVRECLAAEVGPEFLESTS